MPRIPVYQSQVGINAGAPSIVHTPTETTDQQMVQQGVGAFADAAVKLAQQHQAVTNTQNMTAFINSNNDMDQALNDARQQSKTGVDYIPAAQAIIKQHQDDFFSNNPNMTDQEKAQYQARWAQVRGQTENQAINWGQSQANSIKVTNLQNAATDISNRILQDPTSSKALQQGWIQDVNNSDLDPATKAQLQQKGLNSWAYANGLWGVNNAPEHVISQLDQHTSDQSSGSSGTLADQNNNPLNIRYSSGNNWVGKAGDNGTGFEQFDTPEHGLRAGFKLMRNQIANGNDTISSLVSKWAPAGDGNNPVQYAQSVSKATGIPMGQKLDANNPQQMIGIAKAMANQEGYGRNIDDGQADRAWTSVDDPSTLAPGVMPGHLSLEQSESLRRTAQANIDRQQSLQIAQQNQIMAMQTKMENAAGHATDTMQTRIASGQIPSSDDWQNYEKMTQGTSYQGNTETLRNAMVQTQKLYSMPPAQAQQELQTMQLDLKNNGGSEQQYKILGLVQKAISQRQTDVQKNPQSVWAMDSGQPLQPVDPSDALDNPGQLGQELTQRMVNSASISQKYGPTAGKNLLTTDELHNFQDAYARMSAEQRIQFWRNTQASSSPAVASRLATEMGGESLAISSIAGLANTPTGYNTALAVEKGYQLLNPKDGSAKIKLSAQADAAIPDAIKSEYPSLSVDQVQKLTPLVRAFHVGSGGQPESTISPNELHSVIGTPIVVSGATVIAPPGTNPNTYKDSVASALNGVGEFSGMFKRKLNDGTYSLNPDINGNLALTNTATGRKIMGPHGGPVILEVNK